MRDGFSCRVRELWRPGDDFDFIHRAVRRERRFNNDDTLDASPLRRRRVLRLFDVNDFGLFDVAANAYRSCRRWWRHVPRCCGTAQATTKHAAANTSYPAT